MLMGCYGIGVTRIVAAAIEQNHDERGIRWPEPMAPLRWRSARSAHDRARGARSGAEALYDELRARGIEVLLDDRGVRPGAMFADMELIGIPQRIVVSDRGLDAGTYEYRASRRNRKPRS